MPDGCRAPVWFLTAFVNERFSKLSKLKKYDIAALNNVVSKAVHKSKNTDILNNNCAKCMRQFSAKSISNVTECILSLADVISLKQAKVDTPKEAKKTDEDTIPHDNTLNGAEEIHVFPEVTVLNQNDESLSSSDGAVPDIPSNPQSLNCQQLTSELL